MRNVEVGDLLIIYDDCVGEVVGIDDQGWHVKRFDQLPGIGVEGSWIATVGQTFNGNKDRGGELIKTPGTPWTRPVDIVDITDRLAAHPWAPEPGLDPDELEDEEDDEDDDFPD